MRLEKKRLWDIVPYRTSTVLSMTFTLGPFLVKNIPACRSYKVGKNKNSGCESEQFLYGTLLFFLTFVDSALLVAFGIITLLSQLRVTDNQVMVMHHSEEVPSVSDEIA